MNALGPFVVAGMVIGAGALLIIMGALRSPVRLADALAVLDGSVPETRETHPERKGLEALGDWLHGTLRLPLTRNQQRLLLLSGRSIADFFAEKLVLTTTGLFLPAIWLVVQVVLGNPTTPDSSAPGPCSRGRWILPGGPETGEDVPAGEQKYIGGDPHLLRPRRP